MKKIAVITCYFDPDYVRARTIRAALQAMPDVRPIVLKNTHKGLLRYPEIIWKLWRLKRAERPDAYFLTFRGQEILPFVLLLAGKKPVIFDELIVPIAYATGEHHNTSVAIRIKHGLARMSEPLYRRWLRRCAFILADSQAHADLSARTSDMNLRKYVTVPVGTDEKVFVLAAPTKKSDAFQVFYYSTGMQPLHGVPIVLAAAELLRNNEAIEFLIVGGKKPLRDAVLVSQGQGAHVRYEPWIPFEKLPATMRASGLNLGGPFGDTPQAQNVITTKTYQSLACAVPTLVGASPATSEYFVDKQNALVVTQADAEKLASAITWASTHPTELKAIGENGRKLFEKSFSTAAIARRLQPIVDAID
jgi:glycosyltransferase involved in cell wall biosynthesis